MENPNAIVKKLLFALNRLGKSYKLSTINRYNEEKDKMITQYCIYKIHPKKDGENFYSITDVVIFLADKYKEAKAGVKSG